MEIIFGTENIPESLPNPVLTIGNFDGIHLGHQSLFRKVIHRARALNGTSMVMTFDPHPIQVLSSQNGLRFITPLERKLELIATCGIDMTLVIPFSRAFAQISAQDFVKEILVDQIGVKAIIVGYDYRFGRNREGDIEFLKTTGEQYGFEVEVVSGIQMEGTMVSSTAIRRLIQEGEIKKANRLLGRPYEISGVVVKGRERGGRLLGFPTANVRMSSQASPKTGVYAVKAELEGHQYNGAANLGYNPTFGDTDLSLEVHLFDFNQDIYSQPITVRFIDRLRSEKRFSGPDELASQIRKDVEKAREVLAQEE